MFITWKYRAVTISTADLSERKLDLAILNKPLNGLPVGLEFLNLGEDIYHLAVPDNHPLANQTEVSLSELADERFIFHQTGQVAMVQGGLGIALLPSEEFKSRTLGGIVELKLKETIRKEVGVAWRKDTASPLVEATVRFAKEWVDYA